MRFVPSGQYGTSWAWLCRVMRKPWAAATDPGRPGKPWGPSEPGGPGYPRWPGVHIHSYFKNGKKKKQDSWSWRSTHQADRRVRCPPFCHLVQQSQEVPPSLDFQVHLLGLEWRKHQKLVSQMAPFCFSWAETGTFVRQTIISPYMRTRKPFTSRRTRRSTITRWTRETRGSSFSLDHNGSCSYAWVTRWA